MRDKAKTRRKGFQYERELVRLLWKKGFACMRAPASGSKVKRAIYPDVIALKNGVILVFEVKVRSKPEPIYVEKDKIDKLKEFCYRAGGRGFIAIKYIGLTDWRFIPVEILELTPSGNYRITRELVENGFSINDLVKLTYREDLTKFMK